MDQVNLDQLPPDWREHSALERLRTIGTEWATQQSSAILAVPSAVVPTETNYLLNPKHPRSLSDLPTIIG